MAFTEFVVPTLKTDPETEATFMSELAPFLIEILETHVTPPKHKYFGKILLENGNDVSGDFRLVMGLGTRHFLFFVPFLLIASSSRNLSHFISHFPLHSYGDLDV